MDLGPHYAVVGERKFILEAGKIFAHAGGGNAARIVDHNDKGFAILDELFVGDRIKVEKGSGAVAEGRVVDVRRGI